MKTLTILTQNFRKELKNFGLHCSIADANLYLAKYPRDKFDIECFTNLLERIVILQHPVYSQSPKLADIALELRATEIHQLNTAELANYLASNTTLHLEGYTTFRMADYRHRLDVVMYCIIKKLNLAESLLL